MIIRNSKPGKYGILYFIDRMHMRLDQAIEGLIPQEVNWRPSPSSNTIGNLLKHMNGTEAFWIHYVAGGMETQRDRASEFEIRDFPMEGLLEEYRQVKEVSRRVIEDLTEEELAESRSFKAPRTQSEDEQHTTVHWCLMHTIEASTQHIGQIFYIRKMYTDLIRT